MVLKSLQDLGNFPEDNLTEKNADDCQLQAAQKNAIDVLMVYRQWVTTQGFRSDYLLKAIQIVRSKPRTFDDE